MIGNMGLFYSIAYLVLRTIIINYGHIGNHGRAAGRNLDNIFGRAMAYLDKQHVTPSNLRTGSYTHKYWNL